MIKDEFQDLLEADLAIQYAKIQYDPAALDELQAEFWENAQTKVVNKIGEYMPVLQLSISANGVENIGPYSANEGLCRQMTKIFTKTVEWANTNKLPIPKTTIYIWISDKPCYHVKDLDKRIPLHVICRQGDRDFIIVPDGSFCDFSFQTKYGDESTSWDQTKELLLTNSMPKIEDTLMYFKGTMTGQHRTDIRRLLKEKLNNVIIDLDGWANYSPLWEFSQYKYLLNLPGHGDWSNRLKYLFLLESLIINIDVISEYIPNERLEYESTRCSTFIDLIVKPNIDYVSIDYTYYGHPELYDFDPIEKGKYLDKTALQKKNLVININRKFFDIRRNPLTYQNMITSGMAKVSQLTENRVYQYLYKSILLSYKAMSV